MMVKFKVEGMERVRRSLNEISKDMKVTADTTVLDVAKWGMHYARTVAPIDTSALIRAIRYEHKTKSKALIVSDQPDHPVTGRKIPYHFYQEFGTTKITPRRYMKNTADRVRSRFAREMDIAVSDVIKRW